VAIKARAPKLAPGALPPPAFKVPDPSLRNPWAVIWKPSAATFKSDAPEPE
jgi:hypothetical protein